MPSGEIAPRINLIAGAYVGILNGELCITRPSYARNERIYALSKDAWLDGSQSFSLLFQIRTTKKGNHNVEAKCWRTLGGIQLIVKATQDIRPSQELLMAERSGWENEVDTSAGNGHDEAHASLKTACDVSEEHGDRFDAAGHVRLNIDKDYEEDDISGQIENAKKPRTRALVHYAIIQKKFSAAALLALCKPICQVEMSAIRVMLKRVPCCQSDTRFKPHQYRHIKENCKEPSFEPSAAYRKAVSAAAAASELTPILRTDL